MLMPYGKEIVNVDVDAIMDFIERDETNIAQEILKQGHWVVYVNSDTPDGCVLKEYPNGRIELLEVDILRGRQEVKKVIRDGR
ncbi:MAG: hypothetical protein LBO72_02230 [Helicobacteraceae bacterium]|jgi:hypothetical protein|nr:hypothetical protein [Helicobacteraceae bacterium]